jgi:predicted DNA-binding transcriptional regulator AlpA
MLSSVQVSRSRTGGGDPVHSLKEFAALAGISVSTLRRLIDAGDGPVVTKLSPRRLGIRVSHGDAWLDARAGGSAE